MGLLPFDLPTSLVDATGDARWASWVAGVPRLVADLLAEWELVVDGAPAHRGTSLVVPVLTGGRAAVLKVASPREESRHEVLALQHWHGDGAVLLLRADPRRGAMVLERPGSRDLGTVGDVEACEVVGGLYARLHVPAPARLALLSAAVARRTADLERVPRSAPLPHRIVEQAVSLGRSFVSDAATDGTLVHGDLHYGNVLAGTREPWLVVDPLPLSGDPHHEVDPVLCHRWDEVVASGDVRRAVRRRFHTVVDAAGLDEERARDWVVVREAHAAMRAIEVGDLERVTTAVAIVKAVQD